LDGVRGVFDDPYVTRMDLVMFASGMRANFPDVAIPSLDREVVELLWEIITTDLPRYVRSKGWPLMQMRSAEKGVSLHQSFIPPHIQMEGVAIARLSLRRLPVEEVTEWRFGLFRHDNNVWYLFDLWIRYLRQQDST